MRISVCAIFALVVAPACFALPVSFERTDATCFVARYSEAGPVEVRPDRVSMAGITMRFSGNSPKARIEGLGAARPSTYIRAGFIQTNPQFSKLAIRELYPGVDAIFYGSGDHLEYDLQLKTGAAADRIRISVEGAQTVKIDDGGNLKIQNGSGVVQQMRPRVFQANREIAARFVLLGANRVAIELGKHDRKAAVTIDPVLAYTRTFGAAGNAAALVATDRQGNIYLAGRSGSLDIPSTSNSFNPPPFTSLRVLSNAGQTIANVNVPKAYSVGTTAATADGNIVYAATFQGILLSGDAGATWRQTSPIPVRDIPGSGRTATVNAISIDPLDPATILVATTTGLYGTNSGGQFWGERNTGLNFSASGFASVAWVSYHPANPAIVYAVTSGPSYLYASADAGNTWRRLDPTYPGDPPVPVFSFNPNLAAALSPDGGTLYAINGNGTLLKTVDGGTTWTKLASGFFSPLSIQVDRSNPSTIYVLDQRGQQTFSRSVDGGVTFEKVTTPIQVRSFTLDSSGFLYTAGFERAVYLSKDGGKTFAAIPRLPGVSSPSLSSSGERVYVGTSSPTLPFVMKLDPTGTNVLYSTFLGGGSGDFINGLAVDADGNAVLAGFTLSPDFPFTVAAANPPVPDNNKANGFLTKLSADGTRLIYSNSIDAMKSVSLQSVALDSSGAVLVTGQSAGDIPTTANAFQTVLPAQACIRPPFDIFGPPVTTSSAFVSKIGADGKSTVYTTFLTGSCGSFAQTIATDAAGDAIVGGSTTSPDFPVSASAYQPAFPGVADSSAKGILNAGFLVKLSPAGDKLLAGTFLGGSYTTGANSLTLDASGDVLVTGSTQGFTTGATAGVYQPVFRDICAPISNIGPGPPYRGTSDAFVLKMNPDFTSARFLTYLGGGCGDGGNGIALDPAGNIWVAGSSTSSDFPLKDPFQVTGLYSGQTQGFLSELSSDASQLLFSTFSEGSALALAQNSVYLAGSTAGAAFVSKIEPGAPAISIDAVRPATAFPPVLLPPFLNGFAPGELIHISGRNLGPATPIDAKLDVTGRLPFILSGVVVFFDNIPAPLLSVSATGIDCFVPFETVATTKITVLSDGRKSNEVKAAIVSAAPQILKIVNADGNINSAEHPAKVGSVIALFISGMGQTNPPAADGVVNALPLPVPVATVFVSLPNNAPVTPQFVGAAPGMIAGITQLNIALPASIGATDLPIAINVGGSTGRLYVTP